MYELPHLPSGTTGDTDAPVPELHLAELGPAAPTPETMLHALYAAAAIGHRLPPYQVDGDRPIDRSLARIHHHLLTEIVVEHGFVPGTRLGLQVLRLCQQSAAYTNGRASVAWN